MWVNSSFSFYYSVTSLYNAILYLNISTVIQLMPSAYSQLIDYFKDGCGFSMFCEVWSIYFQSVSFLLRSSFYSQRMAVLLMIYDCSWLCCCFAWFSLCSMPLSNNFIKLILSSISMISCYKSLRVQLNGIVWLQLKGCRYSISLQFNVCSYRLSPSSILLSILRSISSWLISTIICDICANTACSVQYRTGLSSKISLLISYILYTSLTYQIFPSLQLCSLLSSLCRQPN